VKPHPQVEKLLEAAGRSPLPPYHTVPAFVARRIYRDTRAAVAPKSRVESVATSDMQEVSVPSCAVALHRGAGLPHWQALHVRASTSEANSVSASGYSLGHVASPSL